MEPIVFEAEVINARIENRHRAFCIGGSPVASRHAHSRYTAVGDEGNALACVAFSVIT